MQLHYCSTSVPVYTVAPLQHICACVSLSPQAGCVLGVVGEITIVGPALSSLDADLAFKQEGVAGSKDARRQAQMSAAAQEARGMLGG